MAGRWYRVMLAKPDGTSSSATLYCFAERPLVHCEFEARFAADARDELGGSVRFLTERSKVAARLELLASKTIAVTLDGVELLYADDIEARWGGGRGGQYCWMQMT